MKEYKYLFGNNGKSVIIPLIFASVFVLFTVILYLSNIIFYVAAAAIALLILGTTVLSVVNKIVIYDDGFMHQHFFKKTYYKDSEIEKAWISDKLVPNNTTQHFFHFKTKTGKSVKYYFSPNLYEYGEYLVMRIAGEDVSEYEYHLDNE